jgi:hypothetical protein
MPKPKLIVIVEGGVVQEIVTNQPVAIILVDHDSIRQGDRPGLFPDTIDPSLVRSVWSCLRKGDVPKKL